MRPLFLITNDDGIQSEGLFHLYQAVEEIADVVVVAPDQEKSACSVSITWNQPLKIVPVPWANHTPAFSVNGTPADCVKMAMRLLLKKRPDLILSGINHGSNAGRTVLYSGTIAGAIEATLQQVPAIAFSFAGDTTPSLSHTKPYIQHLIHHVLNNLLPEGTLLNVNFPKTDPNDWQGARLTRQGSSRWAENPDERLHPEGNRYYWLGGKWENLEEKEDSDVKLLEEDFVTITPLKIGHLTDETFLKSQQFNFQSFKNSLNLSE